MSIDAEAEIDKLAKNMSRDDVEDLLGKESTAERLSKKAGILSQYWDDITTSFSLIRDWFSGESDKIPGRMIASLAGALISFISPVDLIPDWIPMAGFFDDAAILAAVFKLSEAELKFYRKWKQGAEAGESETE